MADAFYVPPVGEYRRPGETFRIEDPRGRNSFDKHFVRGAFANGGGFAGTHDSQELDMELVPEPCNPHDRWAVSLHVNGTRIGYIGAGFASMWQDIVVALNRSGKAVVATGLIDDVNALSATVFLPWLHWNEEFGPKFSEECEALITAMGRDDQLRILGKRLQSQEEAEITLLQSLSALAPSLNWGSQEPGREIPLQLGWHMRRLYEQKREEKLAAEEAALKAMRAEVYQFRTSDGATFTDIAERLGCSSSTASKRYREYLDALTDDARAAIEANLAEHDEDLKTKILEEHARSSGIGVIARIAGCSQTKVRQVLEAAGVAALTNANIAQRDERLERCREACRMQDAGLTRREIAAVLGCSLDTVKALLKDGKFYDAPRTDIARLRKAMESRSPELDILGIQPAAEVMGMSPVKFKALRKDYSVLSQLYGAYFMTEAL